MNDCKRTHLEFPPRNIATRSLKDFLIPGDAINPDAELGKRTDECTMELLRMSLLGIAGYGFLLKEMALSKPAALAACQRHVGLLLTGAGLLAITAGATLLTREWLVRCSTIQIMILRTFAKLENGRWTEQENCELTESISAFRNEQTKKLTWTKYSLRIAHWCLTVGAIVTVVSFGVVLLAIPVVETQTQGPSTPQITASR